MLSACVADEEAQPSASPQILIHNDYHRLENHRLHENLERLRHDLNIPRSNPHRHLNDPYDQHSHRDYQERNREEYDNRRDDMGRYRDGWQEHVKHEKQWWTDKDKIEHVDDDEEVRPVILRTIKSHEDVSNLTTGTVSDINRFTFIEFLKSKQISY